jgi:hypothetical protein
MDKSRRSKASSTKKVTKNPIQNKHSFRQLSALLSILLVCIVISLITPTAFAIAADSVDSMISDTDVSIEDSSLSPVCAIEDQTFTTISCALDAIRDGQTVKLLQSIDYFSPVLISGKAITLDLNGYELNIETTVGAALTATNGGVLALSDSRGGGELNVESTDIETGFGYGVYATAGSQVMVTNATGTSSSVLAAGLGADIVIYGDAFSYDIGLIAVNDSTVSVYGDVIGVYLGVCADDASVFVRNNVMATELDGIYADNCADVTVGGNVLAGVVGVTCANGSHVTVGGMVFTYQDYIKLDEMQALTMEHGFIDGQKPGYIDYANGLSYVWVKDIGVYNLANAKNQKITALNSVANGFSEDDYTAESWAALQLAVTDAFVELEAARSIVQAKAVVVPDARAILVPRQVVGAPGSGDPYNQGVATLDVALMVARVICGAANELTVEQIAAVDMDFDGVLTMTDVMLIMRKALGF